MAASYQRRPIGTDTCATLRRSPSMGQLL